MFHENVPMEAIVSSSDSAEVPSERIPEADLPPEGVEGQRALPLKHDHPVRHVAADVTGWASKIRKILLPELDVLVFYHNISY